jgi:hypothetical protein
LVTISKPEPVTIREEPAEAEVLESEARVGPCLRARTVNGKLFDHGLLNAPTF